MDCDSAVLKIVKKISMTSNVLPLHFALARPAQAKIQMLTTRWRVIRSNLLSLIIFFLLYFTRLNEIEIEVIKPIDLSNLI